MKINKDSLKVRANILAKKYDVHQNTIYNRFFYDAFLSRLVLSKFKDKFILKGGLYLSSILGIETRYTMDIDFYLDKIKFQKDIILEVIKEIISINIDDGITFVMLHSKEIRNNDLYGGFSVTILGN